MKNFISLFLSFFVLAALTACGTPPAEQVMSPLTYDKPVTVHLDKKAKLYWQTGSQQSSVEPRYSSGTNVGGSLPIALASQAMQAAIETEVRKNNPGRFTYVYGKAQQAVFMTSLKDILQKKRVFTDVDLVTDKTEVNAQDVLITINFKSTRVLDADLDNHKIVLNVDMIIQSNKKPIFTRTYVVQSGDEVSGFKAQQEDVSKRLLDKVMKGIKQWASTLHP